MRLMITERDNCLVNIRNRLQLRCICYTHILNVEAVVLRIAEGGIH